MSYEFHFEMKTFQPFPSNAHTHGWSPAPPVRAAWELSHSPANLSQSPGTDVL